jgi:DNA-binding IscR family transcriptional regulator
MKRKKSSETTRTVRSVPAAGKAATGWTFMTNHSHVLLCLYQDPDITLREVSILVGITERMVQKIVAELVEAGFLIVTRVGRRNTYKIALDRNLRHPLEAHRSIGDILKHIVGR